MTDKEKEAIDKSLASLSIEQRIAVKAQLMKAGLYGQNAAESLPAEAEQKLGTCMASFVPHTRGTYCIDWTPVAPVEAKDNGYICNKCSRPIAAGLEGLLQRCPDGGWCSHETVAEPKPTPSTPADQVMAAVNWAMGCSDDDFVKPENAPTYWWRSGLAKRAGIIYDGQKYVKPQPDSSSIPCTGCEGHPVATNDPCAVCGSSSISTEPEQIVDDDEIQAAIDDHKTFWSEEIAIELQQWRKWAAAKGSK